MTEIEPATCGKNTCPPSFTGKFCETEIGLYTYFGIRSIHRKSCVMFVYVNLLLESISKDQYSEVMTDENKCCFLYIRLCCH